jgi:hypothetical protein
MDQIRCRNCQREFKPTREWQAFCRPHCRSVWHEARDKFARDLLKKIERGEAREKAA